MPPTLCPFSFFPHRGSLLDQDPNCPLIRGEEMMHNIFDLDAIEADSASTTSVASSTDSDAAGSTPVQSPASDSVARAAPAQL